MRLHHITAEKAEELMEKADKKRSTYYNYYSYKTWGAAATYHLCIDSSVLGIEGTIDFPFRRITFPSGHSPKNKETPAPTRNRCFSVNGPGQFFQAPLFFVTYSFIRYSLNDAKSLLIGILSLVPRMKA